MRSSSIMLAVAGLLGAAPSAYAHQTYNVGTLNDTGTGWAYQVTNGWGNNIDGAINGSQHFGPNIDPSKLVWRSGVGAAPPEYNGNLPEMWYSGLHNTATGSTTREFGSVSSATGTTFVNAGSSLQARIATYNAGQANPALQLDPNSQIAVKGNSWLTGVGLDYGVTHVTCGGSAAACLAAGPLDIGWELHNLNPTSSTLLGIAIYGGWDHSEASDRNAAFNGATSLDNPQGSSLDISNLLFSAVTTTPTWGVLSYSRLFDAAEVARYNGEYTIIVGALNDTGDGQYYLKNTSVAAVPIPAAVWLFGSALAGMGVVGRRKSAVGTAALAA